MTIRSLMTSAAVAGAVVALAACGSEDGGGSTGPTEDQEAAALNWARCMREHGVDIPDPSADGGPQKVELKGSRAAMERAQEACKRYQDAARPDLTPEQETELRDQALAFARCMREHGVDMPDPQVEGGGIIMRARKGASGFDPDSPAFKQAAEACEQYQPKRPGA